MNTYSQAIDITHTASGSPQSYLITQTAPNVGGPAGMQRNVIHKLVLQFSVAGAKWWLENSGSGSPLTGKFAAGAETVEFDGVPFVVAGEPNTNQNLYVLANFALAIAGFVVVEIA